MKIRASFLIAICVIFGAASVLQAQEIGGGQSQGGSRMGGGDSGPMQVSSMDTQGIRRYLLGPGDTLQIRVWGQPDLSGDVDVDDQGNISELHFIETPIPARCRTEKEVATDIETAYKKFLKNPQVSVRVTGRNSRPPAFIFGAVRVPSRVQMQRRVRLQELITVSGGITEQANGDIQIMHTEEAMCPEPGDEVELALGQDGTVTAPMKIYKMEDLVSGKVASNPLIRPGDIVIVTEAKPVYITGSVVAPQGVYLQNGMTITRAIALVGGIKKDANAEDIRIFRQKPGTSEQKVIKVNFSAIKKMKAPDVLLEPYDIIDVPQGSVWSPKILLPMLAQAVMQGGVSTVTGGISSVAYRVIY
ncbi:MAG TPA: polysaccharide biosynthesis/export family protein [Pyrinomonadaceae bacterium]|nr:polysaccharide biosynthesis/export family protein [Pyrinomonadaceae bacterium]